MDNYIRIFDPDTSELMVKLEGHSKGVISFSWTVDNHLISGSWDGTAKIWDLESSQVIKTLGGHENGVHVLGLKSGLIVTTSTGESVDGKPANFQIRYWDPITGRVQGDTIRDHQGPIRSIAPLPGMDGILTGSNDGTVMMRSIEGQPIEILMHPLQDDGSPPFVLDCSSIPSDAGMDFVSGAEDGSVVVWCGGERVQVIPHPNTVWTVLGLPQLDGAMAVEGQDTRPMYFMTGGHDGTIRIFTNDPLHHSNPISIQLSSDFVNEVTEAKRKKTSGPSADEVAKAPKWEQRGNHPGKSENQVMVFNQNGSLIAAQWNSGAWVVIGEVTGTGDGEYLDGVWYDHVFPVEIETPQGLKTLKLGYNNQENPFIAAQRFIDANGLSQVFLQQIADWIIQRAGKSATPTIGGSTGGSFPTTGNHVNQHHNVPPAPPMSTPPTPLTASLMKKFPSIIRGYVVFDEVPNVVKCMSKVREFNDSVMASLKLSDLQLQSLENLVKILSESNRYHASEIELSSLLLLINNILVRWSYDNIFIAFDLLRLIVIHPHGSDLLAKNKTNGFDIVLQQLTNVLSNTIAGGSSHATVLTALRCVANMLKSESLRRVLYQQTATVSSHVQHSIPQLVLDSIKNHGKHANKLVRAGVMTFALNYVASKTINRSVTNTTDIDDQRAMDGIATYALTVCKEEHEYPLNTVRALQIVGSMLVAAPYTSIVLSKITSTMRDSVQHAQSTWAAKGNQDVVTVAKEVLELL